MKKLRTKWMVVVALMGLTAFAAPKRNVLSLKESITDNNIVFPYSFQTDTHDLMKNWYLQNYAVLDKDVEKKPTGEVSDAEYIRRLQAMPTVIEMPYNQIVRSYIDRYVKRSRTLVEQMLGMSLYYMPIFEEALEREKLPNELKYIPVIESAMNPEAVSPAGAAGLWQFMPATGKSLGLEVNSLVDERRDPYRSSDKAAKFFKQLYEIYGDWSLAIAAYNCGPGNVNKAIVRSGNENADFWAIYNYLPRETRGYVPAFIAATYIMENYHYHNISPALAKKPLLIDTVTVNRRVNFNQISGVLNIPVEELRILNPQFRQDVIPGDNHPYRLALPAKQIYSYIMAEDSIARYRKDVYGRRDRATPGSGDFEVSDIDYTSDAGSGYTAAKPATDYVASTDYTAPAGGSVVTQFHKVQKGESLASIAINYGMDPDALMALNGLTSNHVHNGQILKVEKHVRDTKARPTMTTPEDMAMTSARPSDYDSTLKVPEGRKKQQQQQVTVPQRQQAQPQQQPQPSARQQQRQQAQQAQQAQQQAPATASYSGHSGYKQASQNAYSGKGKYHKGAYAETTKGKKGKKAVKPAPPVTHEVKSGESLTVIAKKNGTTVDALKKANGIKGDVIRPGQKIVMPGKNGKAAKAEAPAKASKKGKKDAKAEAPAKTSKKGKKKK